MAPICLYTTAQTQVLIICNLQGRIMDYHQIAVQTVYTEYKFIFMYWFDNHVTAWFITQELTALQI